MENGNRSGGLLRAPMAGRRRVNTKSISNDFPYSRNPIMESVLLRSFCRGELLTNKPEWAFYVFS
jgi:hypothetical protein